MSMAKPLDLYLEHIQPLPPADQLRIVGLIVQHLGYQLREAPAMPTRSIKDLHGVAHATWDGSDAQDYVNKLREEWDERP